MTKDAKKDLMDKIIQAIRDTDWSWEEAWEIFREAEFAYEKTYMHKRSKQSGLWDYGGYGRDYLYTGTDVGGVNSTGISSDFKGITKQVKENSAQDEKVLKDLKKKHKSLDNKS